ncbi:ferredoxin [Epibacterium sp. SM1979]|uniref:Ferredoxin n=1 Tax=Tritonibacter litoralis TaxID=2662264 RepID=A0A843YGD2_9RHOB|nr:pyridoxamine 5'-phosphate oxidase family protein [Tritonibacter litoralis]MQQ08352.1 ferredoxin [Tritonibacter litoralis]
MTVDPKWDATPSPFHAGEISMQEQLGVRRIEAVGRRAIRPFMPDQHRNFFMNQPFMVAAARDSDGRPWATILEGDVGFVTSSDDKSLTLNTQTVAGDALSGALNPGDDLGLIGIELATRRRNRVNGQITAATDGGLQFAVRQSFGNCPQHIHARTYHLLDQATPGPVSRSTALTADQQRWITGADTFFIATGFRGAGTHAGYGMDASHRGGAPGFVEVVSPHQLRFPDYPGNNYYNTLGNILNDKRAGLLFLDFASGSLLQISGRAAVDATPSELEHFPGARRLVTVDIEQIVELPSALRLRWQADGDAIRELRLVEKRPESADVKSFVFEARDRGVVPEFRAGQYLPVEVSLPGVPEKLRRSYSLTNLPGENLYRITVKRDPRGIVSRYLHDFLEVGDFLSAFRPAGDFALPGPDTPIMLISAGIGITPMISLLQAALKDNPSRKISFLHGARDALHHPFAHELNRLERRFPALSTVTCYSRPDPSIADPAAKVGRLTPQLLSTLALDPDTTVFVCGPDGFTMDWVDGLTKFGVPSAQIQTESFGASS